MNRRSAVATTAALLALACLVVPPRRVDAAAADSDPRAVKIVERAIDTMGGRKAWDALPGIRWSFDVMSHDTLRSSRHHTWNKQTGEHRVEGKLRSGDSFIVVHTLGDTTNGSAWINGRAMSGDTLHTFIQRGYAMWVNDSYWFLMPWKMLDPGVHLAYDSEVKDSLGTFDRIAMTFDHVGLTPGDHYWVDISRKTHRVERWQYVLQGQSPPPERWTWEGWEQHDGLWFPTAHKQAAMTIATRDVETPHTFDPGTFRNP